MEKKVIVAIIAVLVVAGLGVYGYIKFVPSEEELYNEKMSIILDDMKVIKNNLNGTDSFNSTNSNKTTKKIDNITSTIDNDLTVLNDLKKSISNTTYKEYIDLCSNYLKQEKSRLKGINDEIIILNDVNKQEITLNEALSKMADLDKKVNNSQTKTKNLEKQIKEYENKYPSVLVNGRSILNATK